MTQSRDLAHVSQMAEHFGNCGNVLSIARFSAVCKTTGTRLDTTAI